MRGTGKINKKIAFALALLMLISLTLSGCGKQEPKPEAVTSESDTSSATYSNEITAPEKDENVIEHWINNEGYVVTVDVNHDDYKTAEDPVDAPEKLSADMRVNNILSDFDPKRGKSELNHPDGIASDGQHFVVCDTWNNRVLIWNSLPTSNVPADVVIGQKDFESFTAGGELDELNWPVGVTFAGERLIISDTHNNRLMVYDKVPTENGAAADHVIKAVTAEDDMLWPWAVWSDGKRLIETNTSIGTIAFWDDLDAAIAGAYADHVIDTGGTPRTVITDGDYLIISDHNLGRPRDNDKAESIAGSHVWLHYPDEGQDPDFYIDLQVGGTIIDGNLYTLAQNDACLRIYDGLIDSPDEKSVTTLTTNLEYFRSADYNPILYVDGKTYISYFNSSIIAIYDGKVTEENYMNPMGFIGSEENVRSAGVLRGQYQNPVPGSDGTSLAFIDDYNGLIGIYKTIPDSDNAMPDFVYHFPPDWDSPIDMVVDKYGRMLVLTDSSLLIWNHIPLSGELYDKRIEFDHVIGRERSRIEVCDEGILLYSENDKKLYKLPLSEAASSFDNALCSADAEWIVGLSCDGKYAFLTAEEDKKVIVYNVSDLSVYGEVYSATKIHKEGFHPTFEITKDAIHLPNGQFLVADQNEIRVWDSLDAAIDDRDFTNCIALGTLDDYVVKTRHEGVERDEFRDIATDGSLFKPTFLAYSHGHLWVGEYKFSSRLVRYDIKYDGEEAVTEQAEADEPEDKEVSKGSSEYDMLVSQTMATNGTMTLTSPANATIDMELTNDFTIDCAGHDLTISGKIRLRRGESSTMTIINPGKLDLSNLAFEKPANVSVGGDTDYLLVVTGENLDIVPPSEVPVGSRKERTKGFFYEPKSSSVAVRYGGQE